MKNFKSWFAVGVAIALGAGCDPGSALAQSSMTYESLKDFPDFAGSWTPLGPPFVLAPATPAPQGAAPPRSGVCDLPPEFKAKVGARCRQAVQPPRPDCRPPPSFTGNPPIGAGGAFEILFTPGAHHHGRRIWVSPTDLPARSTARVCARCVQERHFYRTLGGCHARGRDH